MKTLKERMTAGKIESCTVEVSSVEELKAIVETVRDVDEFADKVVWILIHNEYVKRLTDEFKGDTDTDEGCVSLKLPNMYIISEYGTYYNRLICVFTNNNRKMFETKEGKPEYMIFVDEYEPRSEKESNR